jgi:hypothetical protein
MAYCEPAEFAGPSGYLKQVDIADPNNLAKVTAVLLRAEKIVDDILQFSYAGYTVEERAQRSQYGAYFPLPAHEIGSVSAVTTTTAVAITYFEEMDNGILYAVNEHGQEYNWNAGRYLVTAGWGFGDVPENVKEVVLEVAVNIWRSAEAGNFSDVVGVIDGGGVGYEKALTARQKLVLKKARQKAIPIVI